MQRSRLGWAALGLVFVMLIAAPAASGAVSRQRAAAIALDALGVHQSNSPVIVFGLPRPVGPGTRLDQDGPGPGEHLSTSHTPFGSVVTIHLHRGIGRRVWLFWADLYPYALFAHPSLLVLIDPRTGQVLSRNVLAWELLINGKLAPFLATETGYDGMRYRVFTRLRSASRRQSDDLARAAQSEQEDGQLNAGLRAAYAWANKNDFFDFNDTSTPRFGYGSAGVPSQGCGLDVTLHGEQPYTPQFGWAAGDLTATPSDGSPEVTGSVGNDEVSVMHLGPYRCSGNPADLGSDCMVIFYDDRDWQWKPNVNALIRLTAELKIRAYRTTSPAGLARALAALKAKTPPCRQITIAMLAHGSPAPPAQGGEVEPTVWFPQKEQKGFPRIAAFTESALKGILARYPLAGGYNLLVMSCFSGRWIGGVSDITVASAPADALGYSSAVGRVSGFIDGMIRGLRAWKSSKGGQLKLVATPERGSSFDRWSSPDGLCKGAGPTCNVELEPSARVPQLSLYFKVNVFKLTVNNTDPSGGVVMGGGNDVANQINCGIEDNGTSQTFLSPCTSPVRQQQDDEDRVSLFFQANEDQVYGTWGIPDGGITGCQQVIYSGPAPHSTAQCLVPINGNTTVSVSWTRIS